MLYLTFNRLCAGVVLCVAIVALAVGLQAQPPVKGPTTSLPNGGAETAQPAGTNPRAMPDYRGVLVASHEESAADRRIREALDAPIKMEIENLHVKEVIDTLASKLKINVVCEYQGIYRKVVHAPRSTVNPQPPMTGRRVLQTTLEPLGFSWVIHDEVLHVVRSENVPRPLVTRIYPVRDLVTVKQGEQEFGEYDSLAKLIEETVDPMSWGSAGGPGSVVSLSRCGTLTALNNGESLDKLSTLLAALHEARVVQGIPWSDGGGKPTGSGSKPIDPRTLRGIRPMSQEEKAKLERVHSALAKQITLRYKDEPLDKICEAIAKELKVPVELDSASLEQFGISTKLPVTVDFDSITAGNGLKWMLRSLGLDYWTFDGTVRVTVKVSCPGLFRRIYPVADLVVDGDPKDRVADPTGLAKNIANLIAPQSWEDAGGPGGMRFFGPSGVLVVTNEAEVLDQIDPYLLKLREIRTLQKIATPTGEEYHKAYFSYLKRERERKEQDEREQKSAGDAPPGIRASLGDGNVLGPTKLNSSSSRP